MSNREEFEVWASKQKLGLAYGDCGFVFSSTEMAWRAWQANHESLTESERYGRQADITIENLERKVAQLAAENAGLKKQAPTAWYIRMTEEVTTDQAEAEKWRGVPLVRVDFETPATDAFLAEVRAQGAESTGEYLKQYAQGLHEEARLVLQDAGELCNGFAAKLRQGGAE